MKKIGLQRAKEGRELTVPEGLLPAWHCAKGFRSKCIISLPFQQSILWERNLSIGLGKELAQSHTPVKPMSQNPNVQVFCIFPFWLKSESRGSELLGGDSDPDSNMAFAKCFLLHYLTDPYLRGHLGPKKHSLAAKRNFPNYWSSWLAFLKHYKGNTWLWAAFPKNPSFLSHLFSSPTTVHSVLALPPASWEKFSPELLPGAGPCSSSCTLGETRATQPP